MSKPYSSGLIGLDVKTHCWGKKRRNRFKGRLRSKRLLVPLFLLLGTGLIYVMAIGWAR